MNLYRFTLVDIYKGEIIFTRIFKCNSYNYIQIKNQLNRQKSKTQILLTLKL